MNSKSSNDSIGGLVVKLAVANRLRAQLRLAPGSIPGRCMVTFCIFIIFCVVISGLGRVLNLSRLNKGCDWST
jgi:hypothetical protein